MRRLSRVGLAGVPGVALTERDRRHLAAHFSSSSGLSGVGAGCTDCGPASVDAGLAAQVASVLGLPDVAKAAASGEQSELMKEAALLASATFDAMKLRKDRLAVLAGITSPTFATLAGKASKTLGGKDEAFRGVLVLMFLTGAIDTHTGKRSRMAADYQKALGDLRQAMADAGVGGALAGLGGLGGLGAITPAGGSPQQQGTTAADYGYTGARRDDIKVGQKLVVPAVGDLTKALARWRASGPRPFYPPARKVNLGDLGSATVSPDSVEIAPLFGPAALIFDTLIVPVQKANGAEITAIKRAQVAAREWEKLDPAGSPEASAKRLAAWIIRFHGDKVTTWVNSSAGISFGEFPGMPVGVFGTTPGWKDSYLAPRIRSEEFGSFSEWIKFHWSRFVALGTSAADLSGIATGANTVFPMRVAALLRLAGLQALARTGQVGAYDSMGLWKPSASGSMQVPPGNGAAYASKATMPELPFGQPEFWWHVAFVQEAYSATYRKQPTDHALFWYGSFGYPVGSDAYFRRLADLESLRLSGSMPPPGDQTDQTNWFAVVFQSVGPVLSTTLSWINTGVKAASDGLCYVFKVSLGPDTGGVMCRVFDALLKFAADRVLTITEISILVMVGRGLIGFFGKMAQGDAPGALMALFAGINQALFLGMGQFSYFLLGVPRLISEERPQSSPDYLPSLERLGAELTRRDPFFTISLTINILTIYFSAGTATTAIASLVVTLAPVFGMILVGPIRRGLAQSKDPSWLSEYRNLPADSIQRAVESLVKLMAVVIVGVITAADAAQKVNGQFQAFAKKKGVAGATFQTTQFVLRNFTGKLIDLSTYIYTSLNNPKAFNLESMVNKCLDFILQLLVLIPVFAEQAGFDKEGMEAAQQIAEAAKTGVAELKEGFKAIFAELSPADQQALLMDFAIAAPDAPASAAIQKTGGGLTRSTMPVMAAVGVAAGLAVGFMVFGGRRGA